MTVGKLPFARIFFIFPKVIARVKSPSRSLKSRSGWSKILRANYEGAEPERKIGIHALGVIGGEGKTPTTL